ncbi:hypothetical protein HHE02_11570 [Helicobacter heilmannii]|uniref:Uncharacterized protein n=1 Tax=Helicobacter heilmannii TaxID=35817 RepID=A0A0K2XQR3_HELHE|nr:hypothetical protein BN341_12300 [Helicobacter heilmannii ASB1.4]CRF46300.1 hypothetical protein HHE014_12980 [Helicobacter heilmannii]CRF47859.1 hypothetical protein HHE02_11570 [Helicobacter heilmannii]CRI34935.1 hypothetical protein HHE01_07360 [Helicobacter heilmannii]
MDFAFSLRAIILNKETPKPIHWWVWQPRAHPPSLEQHVL